MEVVETALVYSQGVSEMTGMFVSYADMDVGSAYQSAKADLLEGKKKWINWIDYVQDVIRKHALSPNVNKELQRACNSQYFHYGTLGSLFKNIQYLYWYSNLKLKSAHGDHKHVFK